MAHQHKNPVSSQHIVIIGAGLCGSLLALRLAQRGHQISVYEQRPDMRKVQISAGRSINLALSDRGLKAMKMVGLEEKVQALCIPMYGRMLHDRQGHTVMAPYSGREEEFINSISRGQLNSLLMEEAEANARVEIHFDCHCQQVDLEQATALFNRGGEEFKVTADRIIATDGAGSILRQSYLLGKKFLFNLSQQWLTHGYKELSFHPTEDGSHKIFKNALHIWGRDSFMLIALPNLDGSFTVTLFLAYEEGQYSFKSLDSSEKVVEFFSINFPDALQLMPHLAQEFFQNPTSPLGTIKCWPWHYKDKTLLMGDAAHAIVPFYGQGMNAAFEDVYVLDQIMDQCTLQSPMEYWNQVFSAYSLHRKPDTDAIAELAIDNFHEMKGHVNQEVFRKKRNLEMKLEKNFPGRYFSKYSLVTFNETLGYRQAMLQGRAQDKAIVQLFNEGEIEDHEDLESTLEKIENRTHAIMEADAIETAS